MTRRELLALGAATATTAAAAALGAASAPPDPAARLFVPAVFRPRPGLRWRTAVTVSSPAGGPVTLERWPASLPWREVETFSLEPGVSREVPAHVPDFPSISSYLFTSAAPFEVTARVEDRTGEKPPLEVPVLPLERLARPGDLLSVGPFSKDGSEDGHFCFTFPRTGLAWTPVRVELSFLDPASRRPLRSLVQVLSGLPRLIERPWRVYALPDGRPFQLEVRWTGTYGRTPPRGLWVYGISRDLRSGLSRFLPTAVTPGRAG